MNHDQAASAAGDFPAHPMPRERPGRSAVSILRWTLLAVAAVFFALHFLHLTADFPNHSPWVDWSKYTDEGWYGDAAIRHFLTGHWYWKGDFNPAVALPVWPAIELLVFRFTGVSVTAARALTLCVFALTLFTFYRLIERCVAGKVDAAPAAHLRGSVASLAAPVAIFLLCASPYFYVFERMAILEPLLIALAALALLAASHLHPLKASTESPAAQAPASQRWAGRMRRLFPSIALGVLLPAMILTKTTAVFLLPAIAYMVWARAGFRLRQALRFTILPALLAAALWLAYFLLFVRPHYLADYRYLFSANAYTGVELEPFYKVLLSTFADGIWMGHILYPVFFLVLALALFWRPRFFRNPLVPSLLLWAAGYVAFLIYHNNLQPRYYLVIAAPVTVLVALAIDFFRQPNFGRPHSSGSSSTQTHRARVIASTLAAVALLAIAVPDARRQIHFILHPQYTFETAAHSIQRIVLADPTHSHLILSISGSDLTLMTGLPSIDDDFGTLNLDQRVAQYHPGWYAAWNELDDDKMDALSPLYRAVRVAAFPAMDDPDRNLLILYRLDLATQPTATHAHRRKTPRPLRTKIGQQPDTEQLQH